MQISYDYYRIEQAIKYLVQNHRNQPPLEEIASHMNMSPFHFQRLFTRWTGISPKKFLQYVTIESLKKELAGNLSLAEIADKEGLSAQSRIYDLFINIEGVTPDEYRRQGSGVSISYGIHPTPFGDCLIAVTERGICSLDFINGNKDILLSELSRKWSSARISRDQQLTGVMVEKMYKNEHHEGIRLFLRGTKFQIKVWEALLKIPFGSVTNYLKVSEMTGNPGSARAVASAIAKNPVAYLIPCHRVIRSEGIVGEYRWGNIRKTAMIGWEKSQLHKHGHQDSEER